MPRDAIDLTDGSDPDTHCTAAPFGTGTLDALFVRESKLLELDPRRSCARAPGNDAHGPAAGLCRRERFSNAAVGRADAHGKRAAWSDHHLAPAFHDSLSLLFMVAWPVFTSMVTIEPSLATP